LPTWAKRRAKQCFNWCRPSMCRRCPTVHPAGTAHSVAVGATNNNISFRLPGLAASSLAAQRRDLPGSVWPARLAVAPVPARVWSSGRDSASRARPLPVQLGDGQPRLMAPRPR
jgi:hypothetical protein